MEPNEEKVFQTVERQHFKQHAHYTIQKKITQDVADVYLYSEDVMKAKSNCLRDDKKKSRNCEFEFVF